MTGLPSDFNDTDTPVPAVCVHDLVAEWVERAPSATAVIDGEFRLDYAELWARSGRIAARLSRSAARRGALPLVRLGLERSWELIVSIIAALRAGRAWIPLDPTYPTERLRWIMADSAGAPLLTTSALAESFAVPDSDTEPLMVEAILREAPTPLDLPSSTPDQPAYVIYTSGSTGRPKGVIIEHRSLVNNLRHSAAALGVRPGTRVLHLSTPCFDVAVWEILAALTEGGCVVVADRETPHSEARLVELCRREHVELVFLLASFLATLSPRSFPTVTHVVTGGELFSQALVDRWAEGREFVYVYGPTEATIFQSFVRCEAGRADEPPTIGRPMENLRYYVVDQNLQPVPAGTTGELLIAGLGVGRGYLDRPELDAEKFLPDPWRPAQRAYRSGDLARLRPDDALDFVGRVDRQVKIRGYRIEPGEVEVPLLSHPAIRQAVVVPRCSASGHNHLIAYLVADAPVPADELAAWLGARVPPYMIPAGFMFLETLPRTPNGKIDRDALPELTPAAGPRVGPRDATERTLLDIFCEVLGVGELGIHDDFFLTGGHSLRAITVTAWASERLGVEVSVRDLFDAPSVAALARRVGELAVRPSAAIGPAPPAASDPLSSAQRGMWLVDQARGPNALYNVPFAWDIEGPLDVERLRTALAGLAERQAIMRMRFELDHGEPRQRAHSAPSLECLEAPEPDVLDRLTQRLVHHRFELDGGSLAVVQLLRRSSSSHRLLFNLHHTICDAWSIRVIAEELAAGYRGEALDLPAISYRDYASWERDHDHEPSLDYWRRQLAELPEPLPLPIDHPRPPMPSGRGERRSIMLPPAQAEACRRLAEKRRTSPFVVLVTVVLRLLYHVTGRRDICIGTPVARRDALAVHDVVGPFVNTLVLRARLDPEAGLPAQIDATRALTLDALAHAACPFERVVEAIDPPRIPGRHPLFDVWVVVLEDPVPLELDPDLRCTWLELDHGISLFDLSFQFRWEADGSLLVRIQYDSELYTPATIELLLARLARLVAATVVPDAPVDLGLDGDRELRKREAASDFDGFDF